MSDSDRVKVNKGDMEDVCTCRHERIWHSVALPEDGKIPQAPVHMHCIRADCPCLQFEADWNAAFGGKPSEGATNTPDRIDATKLNPGDRYMHVLMGCVSVVSIIREFPLDFLLQEMLAAERVLQEQNPILWVQRGETMVLNRRLVEATCRFRQATAGIEIRG